MKQYLNILEKAAISSIITGAASMITTGAKFRVPCVFMKGSCPLFVFTGLAGATTSVLNDGIHYLIKNEVHISKKAQDEASLYLGALAGAGVYYGVMYLVNPLLVRDMGYKTILATGAVAEIGSSMTYNLIKG